nr:serine rich repeat protein [Hymenolepis microstoma]
MVRGAFHHALIIPATFLYNQPKMLGNDAKRLRREVLYDSEDLARHLANYVMNQIPTLSVSHISSKDLIVPDIWSDPSRIYACLFAKASRILFLVTRQDTDAFSNFITQRFQPLLERAETLDYSWKSRFLIVAMGDFRLIDSLPCEVIRFREVGWFRDSMALFILGKKIQEFWTPAYDPPDSTAKTKKLQFVTNFEETETFKSAMHVKNTLNEDKTMMQKSDEENNSIYAHESAPGEDANPAFATSTSFSFLVDIESDRILDINELLFSYNSLSGLQRINQSYSADSHYFSSRSEIGFTGSSSDTEDEPLVSNENRSTSDSVGEMRWSSPDSVSIVQETDVNVLPSSNDDERSIITNNQEDTSIPYTIEEPNIEPPKPVKRKCNLSTQLKDQQTTSSELISKEADVLSSNAQSPTFTRKLLEDMPLEAIQERSVEEDGTVYQSVSEIQENAELPHSIESAKKRNAWRKFSSSDLRVKESTGYELELESPCLEGKDEKSENRLTELMKSSSIHSDLPRSISESTDELNRSDKQKLITLTDRTSGYNTMTSIGRRISQSGPLALDQLSFHSPREETTISEEPELLSQSSVPNLSKMDGRELSIDMQNQNLNDNEIKSNASMSPKTSEIKASPEVVDGSLEQENRTPFPVQADKLTQLKESETDTTYKDTNLSDEYLSSAYEKQLKYELAVPSRADLRNKNDTMVTLPEPVHTVTKIGVIKKPSISELALIEVENGDNAKGERFTTENSFIPESITESIPDGGSIKEKRKEEVITKQEIYESLTTKDEKVSSQPTQRIGKTTLERNAGGRITPMETVQPAQSELITEEPIAKNGQAPSPIKNTSESKSNQQSDVKSGGSIPTKLHEVTYPDSTETPKVQSSSSAAAERKSMVEIQNQLVSEQSSKEDPIFTTKQITVDDEVSTASSLRTVAEVERKDVKPAVPLTEGLTTVEKKTALEGESAKETLTELSNERIQSISSKVDSAVADMEDSGYSNLGSKDSTQIDILDPKLPQEINEGTYQTSQLVDVKEKLFDESALNLTNLNSPNIKKDQENFVIKDKEKESLLDTYSDNGPVEIIATTHPTSSSPAEDELSKLDAKISRKGAPEISNVQQKTAETTFSKPFKMQEVTIRKRIAPETDADIESKRNKNEILQKEEKNRPTARTQAKFDENKPENFIVRDKGKDTIDMSKENKLKEGTRLLTEDKMDEIKPENFLHPPKEMPKYETASLKVGSTSSDKQTKSAIFQGDTTKLIRVLEQSRPYSTVNEESPSQHAAKNTLTQSEDSDHEYTGVPLRQIPLATSPPMVFIRNSTVEQETKAVERRTWRTNSKSRSQRSLNQISVERASTKPLTQPTIVTVKVNTKEATESLKEIGSQEIEIVKMEPLTTNTTPRESIREEFRGDNESEYNNSKEKTEIIKVFKDIKRSPGENNQLGKFPMPLKCASPFSDSDCDPEITSWTMARPCYLIDSNDAPLSHVPPVIAPRTKTAAVEKKNQKGNNQSGMLAPKFYPASMAEAMKTEAAPILRRNTVEIKAKAEHRFSSLSISDGEEQKPVEVVNAETGSTSSRSRVRPLPATSPVTLLHEAGEYKRNLSTQVSKKDKNQGTVTHGPYYRQLEEVTKQSGETPITYWLDRAVGSPTPLQFVAGSDIASDLSATSEISNISSKDLGSTCASRDGTVMTLLSVYKALGKASKILADSNEIIRKQVEELKNRNCNSQSLPNT